MSKGEELLKAWTISSRTCNEIRNLLSDFYSSCQEIDKNAKKFKGVWYSWGCRIPDIQPRIGLPENYIHLYRLIDKENDKFYNFYTLHFVFKPNLLEMLSVSEPLIFGAKTKMSKKFGEWIVGLGQKEGPLEFDIFDEQERQKIIKCFNHKGLPQADGTIYKYNESESGGIWEMQIIGWPLVEINNVNDIITKLIKPLLP